MIRALALTVSVALLAAACSSGSTTPGSGPGGSGGPGSGGLAGATGGSSGATGGQMAGGSGGSGGSGAAGSPGDGPVAIDSSGSSADAADVSAGGDAVSSGWPPVTDYAAVGPFAIKRDVNTGPAGAYDVFRPDDLTAGGRKHPIISWNNGTMYSLDQYKPLLDHWASYGFVVIGAHTNTTNGGAVHKAGIDWLVAQNATAASPYHDTLDVTRIGASGHSQGGGATLAAAANKPGTTGITASLPLMPILSFESDTSILMKQTAPVLLVSATMDPRSMGVADQTIAVVKTEFVNAEFKGVHEDAMNPAMHGPALAWFRFRLMDDQNARSFFYPAATCGLCKDPTWMMVRYKNSP
ncbi:MAG TPA: acetylxylan esterase [Polyangia bacterium]|nr:acetylxylan esterase [Polyangia bacterium]